MINNLIQVIGETELAFIIFLGIIIRKFNGQLSMINLIFIIVEIRRRLISYDIDWDLKSRSDHYFIIIIIYLKADTST